MNDEDELRMAECLNPRFYAMPGAFLVSALPFMEEIHEADGAFGSCVRHDAMSTFTQESISPASISDYPGRALAMQRGQVEQALSAIHAKDAAMYARTAASTELRDAEEYGVTSMSLKEGGWMFDIFWKHETEQHTARSLIGLTLRLHEDNVRLCGESETVYEVNRLLAEMPEYLLRKHGLPASISSLDRGQFSQVLSEDLESYMVQPNAWFNFSRGGKGDRGFPLSFNWSSATGTEIGTCGQRLIELLLSDHGACQALAWARQRESSGRETIPDDWLSELGGEMLTGTWQQDLASLVRHSSLPLLNASRQVAVMATGLEASDLRYFRLR
jgi:hypothetical protein